MDLYKKYIQKKHALLFFVLLILCVAANYKIAMQAEIEVINLDTAVLRQQYVEQIVEREVETEIMKEIQKAELKAEAKKTDEKQRYKKTVSELIVKKRDEIKLSEKEKNILYRIVEAEAGGESATGKMLVANVIINRYLNKSFPDSIKGIVFAHSNGTYQFSPVKDGRYYSVNVSKHTKEAVNNALAGFDNSKGALYFMCRQKADADNVTWFDRALDCVVEYGCHEFFK